MAQIYLASPFFNEDQITRIEKVEKALDENTTVKSVFSPRKDDVSEYEEFSKEWAKVVYKNDINNVKDADYVVAVLDFVDDNVDSGTAYEIGAAVQLGKPVIVFHEKDHPVNLMISESLHAYLKDFDDLKNYDFNTLPSNEYNGKMF